MIFIISKPPQKDQNQRGIMKSPTDKYCLCSLNSSAQQTSFVVQNQLETHQ